MIDKEQLKNKTIAELEEMKDKLISAWITQKDDYQLEMLDEVGKALKLKRDQLTKIKKEGK